MKTALIFGSTGLVGGILLRLLVKDEKYKKIKVFVRSSTSKIDPKIEVVQTDFTCLLYTSPSPRDATLSRMPSSA